MINPDKLAQLKAVLSDPTVLEQFKALTSLEEMKDYLKTHGVSMTAEEIYSAAATIASENQTELDEAQLDTVAGGFRIFNLEINFKKPDWWPW